MCDCPQRTELMEMAVLPDAPTVMVTFLVTVPSEAKRTAQPLNTGLALNPKLALIVPAGTITDAGTIRPALVVLSVTAVSLTGACVMVTVQEPLPPGATGSGPQINWESEDGAADRAMAAETTACPICARTLAV